MMSRMQMISVATIRSRWGETAQRFARDCSGATAVEYALITFIAIAIVVAVSQVGGSVGAMYERVKAAFVN